MGNQRITASDLFLGGLALLLVSVSFYQTWQGLEQIFGHAAIVISLALSLLLLYLCWLLREAKLTGRPTGKLMAVYSFIALFCFMANFNALYTRFMRTDIYTAELRDINARFDKLEADVNAKFNYKYDKATAQNVETKKKQLMEQIQDKGNPGMGNRARMLIKDLEKLLGQKVDILRPVGNDYTDLADRMGRQIDGIVSDLSPEEAKLKTDLSAATKKWSDKIQEILLLPKKDKDEQAQGVIDQSLAEYNKLGQKATNILGEEKFKFEPKESNTQDIGKIGYAFDHAVQNFGVYQLVVLLGCILLDFIIPIILLLVTKPGDNNNNGGSVFTHKRSGNVLIPNN